MKTLPDHHLFKLIREDNERAFSILFDRYQKKLFRHIYQRTNSYTEAEDILQNIFISLWKNRQSILIEDSLLPYLLGAARKSILALYASNSKHHQQLSALLITENQIAYSAEDYMVAEEVETMIEELVGRMPVNMKQSFELSRKENLSVKEIAGFLGLSEQTVKNNITLALQRLRLKLSEKHILLFLLNLLQW